jgi:hypothetical protein
VVNDGSVALTTPQERRAKAIGGCDMPYRNIRNVATRVIYRQGNLQVWYRFNTDWVSCFSADGLRVRFVSCELMAVAKRLFHRCFRGHGKRAG